jgi:hypothetical protein
MYSNTLKLKNQITTNYGVITNHDIEVFNKQHMAIAHTLTTFSATTISIVEERETDPC